MTALLPPYRYAAVADVKRQCPLPPAVWAEAVSTWDRGDEDLLELIEEASRVVDASIRGRTQVPLRNVVLSVRRFVARDVAAQVLRRSQSFPDGDYEKFIEATRLEWEAFLKSASDPSAFLDLAEEGNGSPAASIMTAPQTLAYARHSPYPSDDPHRPPRGSW